MRDEPKAELRTGTGVAGTGAARRSPVYNLAVTVRRRTSSIRLEGVATALKAVQANVTDAMRENLAKRKEAKFHDLPEEKMEHYSSMIGRIARSAAADAISMAFQFGVSRRLFGEGEWPTEHARKAVVDEVSKRLTEERAGGHNELSDEEILSQARHAGLIAKEASAESVAESHLMGVDHEAKSEDHTRQTTPVPPSKPRP